MYVHHESLVCNICDLSSVAPSALLHERTKSQLLWTLKPITCRREYLYGCAKRWKLISLQAFNFIQLKQLTFGPPFSFYTTRKKDLKFFFEDTSRESRHLSKMRNYHVCWKSDRYTDRKLIDENGKKIIRYTIIVIPYVMSIDNFPRRKKWIEINVSNSTDFLMKRRLLYVCMWHVHLVYKHNITWLSRKYPGALCLTSWFAWYFGLIDKRTARKYYQLLFACVVTLQSP